MALSVLIAPRGRTGDLQSGYEGKFQKWFDKNVENSRSRETDRWWLRQMIQLSPD